jgi:hypothetical protein
MQKNYAEIQCENQRPEKRIPIPRLSIMEQVIEQVTGVLVLSPRLVNRVCLFYNKAERRRLRLPRGFGVNSGSLGSIETGFSSLA